MNIIKLNPSQELRLIKARAESVQQPQGVEGAAGGTQPNGVFATPLLCPIANLSHEEFLSTKKFAIYKMQNAGNVHFFPCLLEMPQRIECAAFLCGVSVQQPQGVDGAADFSLQDLLNKAGGIIAAAPQAFWTEENFFFNATSFKVCDMEINKNNYKLYDEVWKKINEKD